MIQSEHLKKLLVIMTQPINPECNVVKDLRKIREQLSNEIKDMTFEQERAYLDKLLADKEMPEREVSVTSNETAQL